MAGFESVVGSISSVRSVMEPEQVTKDSLHGDYVLEDPESQHIYICKNEGINRLLCILNHIFFNFEILC
ncbi:hypothetical protein MA16_Dca001846 [Dendrobium catenatum]|uniref:Uncharacterized protein n=1 Tax=Dendrobium catenatum TaxID=906689 RepID=A0A2I0XDN7_9ASPA|nr:hypothetical protein MA16_Dca001846 [Dendrobium catenatum]